VVDRRDANDLRKYAKACRVLAGLIEKNKQFSAWVMMSQEMRNGQMSRKDIRGQFLRIAKRIEQAIGRPLAEREGFVSAEQAGRLMALAMKRELFEAPEIVRQYLGLVGVDPNVSPYFFFRVAVVVWLSKLQPEGE
jgi:hypothetical protein